MPVTYHVESLKIGIDSSSGRIHLAFNEKELGCLVEAILTPTSTRDLITALENQLTVLARTPINQVNV